MFLQRSISKLFLSIVFWGVTATFGQDNLVNKICAETSDKLRLKVWVTESNVSLGEDVILHFEIKNEGNKQIFLVKKKSPEIYVDIDRGWILVEAPIPAPLHKGGYDYSFQRISPQESYKGEIKIPKEQIIEEGEFNIKVVFGFVPDTEGIDRELKLGEDPAGLRTALAMKMKTIALGEIAINVVKTSRMSR